MRSQPITTRVSGVPESGNNGLFLRHTCCFHSDHTSASSKEPLGTGLGSAAFLTYGNGHASEGLKVANSTKVPLQAAFIPFGEYPIDPSSPTEDITDRPLQTAFTGYEHNDYIKLIYMGARYYLPYIYHFHSRDPFADYGKFPQSQNGYNYVNSNPVNLTDPMGLCAEFGDDGCWIVYDQIINLCPECANLSRSWINEQRFLHNENIYYLQEVLAHVRSGWRPLLSANREDAIAIEAAHFGVPSQIVAGVLEAEIQLDTQSWDPLQTAVASHLVGAWALSALRPDPGVGIGNVHASSARNISRHLEDYYPGCSIPSIGIHPNESDVWISFLLASNEQFSIRLIAADIRLLADYRFGSNEQPLTTDHSNISNWTLQDAVAIWHGYRYGVPNVTPYGSGFESIESFQNRSYSLDELISIGIQGRGNPQESASGAIPIFYRLGLRERR